MKKYLFLLLMTSVNTFATDLPDISQSEISPAVMVRCLIAADQYSNVDVKEVKMWKSYSAGWGLMLMKRLGGDEPAAGYIKKYGSGLFADLLNEPAKYLISEHLNCLGLVSRLDRVEVKEFFPK